MIISRMALPIIILFAFLTLSGCAKNAIYHTVVEGYPSMAERYSGLSPVGQNYARLILYWPEKSFFQSPALRIVIDGENGSVHSDVGYRTAELLDLPAGNYSIGLSRRDRKIQLSAKPGETYCYNIATLKIWSDQKDGVSDEKIEEPKLIPLEEYITDFSEDDIRCAHKQCQVKTIVPPTDKVFQPYSPGLDHDQLTLEARNFNISKDVSRIYITRKMYTLGMVRVGLDGKPKIKVSMSSFVVYEVDPGEHTVVAAISGHNIEQAYRLSTKAGECYFFHSDTFKFLQTTEGQKLVSDYNLVDDGFLKQ
ncbi:hypothetical protein ACFL2E_07375 [Thermodesulfobacteriota bacterium]